MKYSGERAHPNDSTFETDNEMQDKTIQHYKFAKKFISTGFVLDAGTALGFGVNELFPTTAEKIFAVEINKEAVKIATTKNKHKKLLGSHKFSTGTKTCHTNTQRKLPQD